MSRSKNRKIADLISGTTFDDGVVAASEVTGLATVATSGSFNDLSNQPTPFDPSTLATVATTGAYSALSGTPSLATVATTGAYSALSGTPTLGTASTQATGAFATAAQGTTANAALPKAGGAVTGNVTFGDSNKIVMGAGSDLSIYHDGSASRIHDNGTGNLILSATDFQMNNGANNETMFTAVSGGAVTLKHSGNSKLATTTSGIDVTGTVNADALTGIGSIDATTATAIGAAGVGGAVTFLSKTNITASVNFIQVPLASGYKGHIIIFNDMRNTNSQYGESGRMTLTNSGSTEITTNGYYSVRRTDGDSYNMDSWRAEVGIAPSGAESGQTVVTIWNARDSNARTYGFCSYGNVYQSPVFGQISSCNSVSMGVNNSEDNANLRFKTSGGALSGNSDSYSIWGIS